MLICRVVGENWEASTCVQVVISSTQKKKTIILISVIQNKGYHVSVLIMIGKREVQKIDKECLIEQNYA